MYILWIVGPQPRRRLRARKFATIQEGRAALQQAQKEGALLALLIARDPDGSHTLLDLRPRATGRALGILPKSKSGRRPIATPPQTHHVCMNCGASTPQGQFCPCGNNAWA